jgi:hypothetical protein
MTQLLATGDVVHCPGDQPVVGFEHVLPPEPDQLPLRFYHLAVEGERAFAKTFWCGTCALLFARGGGADRHVPPDQLTDRLRAGLDRIEPDVVAAFASILTAGDYLPVLMDVTPRLAEPGGPDDYFSHEQIATWSLEDDLDGAPNHPGTPYYRLDGPELNMFTPRQVLFEFLVPFFPPGRNDPATVAAYLEADGHPTAVALTVVDAAWSWNEAPSLDAQHWALTHFLLDGHHKAEAAARAGRPLRLLSLLALDHGNVLGEYAVEMLYRVVPTERAR